MLTLNKNIEAALEQLEASSENKNILKAILYKEHSGRDYDWDASAPKAIADIIHDAAEGERND